MDVENLGKVDPRRTLEQHVECGLHFFQSILVYFPHEENILTASKQE